MFMEILSDMMAKNIHVKLIVKEINQVKQVIGY